MSEKTINGEREKRGLNRRDFIKNVSLGAAGAVAFTTLSKTNLAQAGETATKTGAGQKAQTPTLKIEDILKSARDKLYPRCRVCPECDGIACAGEVPGMGGIGSGQSFKNNFIALQRVQLNMRTFHDVKKVDVTITLWGERLSVPILAAATGGTTYNMGLKGKMTDEEYIDAILGGCCMAGTLGMAADGIGDPDNVFELRLEAVKKYNGKAIVTIKPRTQQEIIRRIKMIEKAGALAFAVDIDSAGRAARALPGQTVEPKTPRQIKELAQATNLPFIVKGIMTIEEAKMAIDAGAAGIVVSNHGGRVLDYTPGVADVLPKIADKVKGKTIIFADGTVKYGADVLKLLALGADAVLSGRHLLRGAVGGGKEGVALFINKMKNELVDAMVLTGTADVKKVNRGIIV
ncbi:MAG: alpha-hydroxy-acid oxidizing protein [Syntrophorhabdaceae bacterium]|nr:alpha-hydroxy-acid oxidizing protein [Syntrophorhabdales bacterium]MBP9560493.1 alpha-hydroxy-acid oxidizing protein [Syntrophorhabdaceae bacterium]